MRTKTRAKTMPQIKYRDGYKYQLAEDYSIKTDILGHKIDTQFIKLSVSGVLTVLSGYAWDGPSGPTADTKDSMRASLVHDALYQLMRHGDLEQKFRPYADKLFHRLCLEDGMNVVRADYWFNAVRTFAGSAAKPKNKKKIITAP